jgi:hypothetical protein
VDSLIVKAGKSPNQSAAQVCWTRLGRARRRALSDTHSARFNVV